MSEEEIKHLERVLAEIDRQDNALSMAWVIEKHLPVFRAALVRERELRAAVRELMKELGDPDRDDWGNGLLVAAFKRVEALL